MVNFLPTKLIRVLKETRLNMSMRSRLNWNLEVLVLRRDKPEHPKEKAFGAKERTNNKPNPLMASTPGFKPG